MAKLRPHKNRILVEAVEPEGRVGSIVLPEAHKETRPAEAVVVAVGGTCTLDTDGAGRKLAAGDRVLTSRYEGELVRVRGRLHRLLQPEHVLAIITQA